MFHQVLTPVAASVPLSFLVAALPIAIMLCLLAVLRRPAWESALVALVVAAVEAVAIWHFPPRLAFAAISNGFAFATWPIAWTVFNALLLYNVAVKSKSFDALCSWIRTHLPNDRRVVLVLVGFCFGALLEGIAGFGTPVAIAASLLITLGFRPYDALVSALLFNSAPVAFAALGVPITTLSAVTHLPAPLLAQMVGRQLPFLALVLPFYVTTIYAGISGARAVWPILFVAGGSFAVLQFSVSNFVGYPLTDIMSALGSLVAILSFLRIWQPPADPRFALEKRDATASNGAGSAWRGWAPWLVVTGTEILWTKFSVFKVGDIAIAWPWLHNAVSVTLYHGTRYAAIWDFQPLGTGTAILFATIITALLMKMPAAQVFACVMQTWRQVRIANLTLILMIGLAYLMNYSGLSYTLGLGLSSVGVLFAFLAPFVGWLAVLLSGSDTAGNALFGNLQVISANSLALDPVLFAATNASGGVFGKIVSVQNIATGASVTNLRGREGYVFARSFPHSIALTSILSAIVAIQQFVVPWMIPH